MPKKYTKEEFWKLYKKIPQELQDALFAEKTGNNIYNVCKENKLENSLSEIVNYVGQVLTGIMPPENLEQVLEKELELEESLAKRVSKEINQLVFRPIRPILEQLYYPEIVYPKKTTEETISKRLKIEEKLEKKEEEEKKEKLTIEASEIKPKIPMIEEEKFPRKSEEEPKGPTKKDSYREPIEQ